MNIISRFVDSAITIFFILWILLTLFENYSLSAFFIAAIGFCIACILGVRLFIFYKIMRSRLKQK